MDVSIIIVNYNTRKLTSECIDSVFEKTKDISFEVILVDNASSDDSKAFFEKDARITYIYNAENIGFGRANIEGYKYASGRNIFLLNPDTFLINNAIKELCDYLDNHTSAAICGGNLYDGNYQPALSHCKYADILAILLIRNPIRRLFPNQNFNYSDKPLAVQMVSGANMMIKRTVIENLGFFDPGFFMYFEDNEFCRRIKKHNYDIVNVPTAKIVHLEGQSSPSEKGLLLVYDGRKKYILKAYSGWYLWVTFIVDYLLISIDIARARINRNLEQVKANKLRREYLCKSLRDE